MAVEPHEFKHALGRFASGVTVVTVRTPEGEDHGMTASAFSSVALDPPLVLVCIRKGNSTAEYIDAARTFAVNVLADDQVDVSNRFAGYGPGPQERFSDLAIGRAPISGAVWLEGAVARLDCRVHATSDGGDHTIYVGRVEATSVSAVGGNPLIYCGGAYRTLGAKL
jgi:3-hydroxy-9,10-secoandrosta-1,3,5(10)-triene-9,17-dione monooxygenase reductase component